MLACAPASLPVETRGGRACTSAAHVRSCVPLRAAGSQPPERLRRSFAGGSLPWGRPSALRAAPRCASRAARSAWGDRDDRVGAEARRLAERATAEAEREVAFARRQLARAEDEARAQRRRVADFVERRGWGAVAAPALGAFVLASLFGPLILGVLFSGVALAGGVAFMGLLPAIILGSLAFGGLAFGLGLFATATAVVLPSILAAVAVAGGLALGSSLLRAAAAPSTGSAAGPGSARARGGARSMAAEADARRAREAAEDEDLAAAAARELRRFDSELDERERRRQVRGPPWAAG